MPTGAGSPEHSTSSPANAVDSSSNRRSCDVFAGTTDQLGIPDGVDIHSFRRSYATHLLEAGWDPRFVQDQTGHEHASTTGIYQFTSDEFRRSTLRSALDRTVEQALGRSSEGGSS